MILRRLAAAVTVTLTAGALALSTASPATAVPAPSGCPQVEAISVRGSTEAQGQGGSIAGPLVRAVQSQSARTVRTYDLVYPATLSNYTRSVGQGVSALQARLRATSASCPATVFVLAGYSQGGQVIANVLDAAPVPAAGRIRAAVLFGDPSFNGSESFDTGTYTRGRNGIFPRARGALNEFTASLRSYCNGTDNFCQAGASGSGHYRYASDRGSATTFVLGRLGG